MSATIRPASIRIETQKPCYRSIFRGTLALEGGLQRRELVVGLIAEQHAEAHVDHHRRQQHAQERPRRDAFAALEIVTGDAPELPAPGREPGEQAPAPPPCPTAAIAHAFATHSADATSSSPQSRDGVNVSMPGSYPGSRHTGAGSVSSPSTRPNRHSPSPSNSSSCVWCCSTVLRWLTLTRMVSGSSVRTRL